MANTINLTSETRSIPKCTYVPIKIPESDFEGGQAVVKQSFLKHLKLQAGEIKAIENEIAGITDSQKKVFQKFENSNSTRANMATKQELSNIPLTVFKALGQAIIVNRENLVNNERNTKSKTAKESGHINYAQSLKQAQNSYYGFLNNVTATPIGMLNLERIEMTPVGIERGALIATIPLAPGEKTAVVHKEWSVTSQEFTSIVTDSLENYSETGVTENTELSTATTDQSSHNNQFNVNGTVSGRYGLVSATVSSGFTSQNQNSHSANESRKHAISTTRKASSRVKQEHKVTISTTTETGTSETSTRVIKNSDTVNPIRIDYFSMMRKWHVGLYRYGLRLTYDIAIPEPGATLREIYVQLNELQSQIGPFRFSVPFSDITTDVKAGETEPHYLVLAEMHSAQIPLPPEGAQIISVNQEPQLGVDITFSEIAFDIPAGYWITSVYFGGALTGPEGQELGYGVVGTSLFRKDAQSDQLPIRPPILLLNQSGGQNFLLHAEGHQSVTIYLRTCTHASIQLTISFEPTPNNILQWQANVWNALYNAAQNQYYTQQQNITAQISKLQDQLSNVDTLTLRREENEEIMKGVLKWLLGPSFVFMPDTVDNILKRNIDTRENNSNDIKYGTAFTGSKLINPSGNPSDRSFWSTMFEYEEMVKFINQAIEWENVLYFLFPYFWDAPESWEFIRQIRHPDPIRQAFLRAGSSRVVLTVRRGWEEAWVNFVETGGFGTTLMPNHPYLSIAKEIQNYDQTNYPGIPPANPSVGPLPDEGEGAATQSSDTLDASDLPVSISVNSSKGFIIGYTAIIDTYETMTSINRQLISAQEAQKIIAIPDDTHITIERLVKPHDGSDVPFSIMLAGEKGQLIAEWFEYTPTSGTDIAVTSDLTTIG